MHYSYALCMLLCILIVSSPQPTVLFAKKFKNQESCHHFVHFWSDIINQKFCAHFFAKILLYAWYLFINKRGCKYLSVLYFCHRIATLSIFINESQYLTSTYFSPQSKHFKKKCQPKYQNFENMKKIVGSVEQIRLLDISSFSSYLLFILPKAI